NIERRETAQSGSSERVAGSSFEGQLMKTRIASTASETTAHKSAKDGESKASSKESGAEDSSSSSSVAKKKGDSIAEIAQRLHQHEEAAEDSSKADPYIHNGVIDREQLRKDSDAFRNFEYEQLGVSDAAKEAGAGSQPDAVVRQRIRDAL